MTSRFANVQKGLTLVELLVALSLLSLVALLVNSGLGMATRSSDTAEQRVDINQQYRLLARVLKQQLTAAVPLETAGGQILFEGDLTGMTFVSSISPHLGTGGLHRMRVWLVQGAAPRLSLSLQPILPGNTQTEEMVLLRQVSQVRFAYYGSRTEDEPADWHERWQDRGLLPVLVRIDVVAHGRTWPSIYLSPRVNLRWVS